MCAALSKQIRRKRHFWVWNWKRDEIESKSSENLLAIKKHDKKDVRVLSIMHIIQIAPFPRIDRHFGENILKLACIVDYNENMGAVDKRYVAEFHWNRKEVNQMA